MTVREVVQKMTNASGGDSELYYLSTQQSGGDGDENDDVDDTPNPYQTPCNELLLAKKIESTLQWASNLKLESCNLWMGSSRTGSSSGLHHDYHDNFYLLVKGKKRFRLYSPDTASVMDTYGKVEKVHFNGLISYIGSETLADGSPVQSLKAPGRVPGGGEEDDDDDDNEVELVLGKGFDYKSEDEDEDDADFDEDGHDDYEELVESVEDRNEEAYEEAEDAENNEPDKRPNSFCKTDPHDRPDEFKDLKEYNLDLTAGEILYLPAGWFHCVTSFSGQEDNHASNKVKPDNIHLALNYWYHPPTKLTSFRQPYDEKQELFKNCSR